MTRPTTSMTFGDLYEQVSLYLGYGDSPTGSELTRCKSYVNAAYREFLNPTRPSTGRAHSWSFLEPRTTITIWPDQSATTVGLPDYSATAGTSKVTITSAASIYDSMERKTLTFSSSSNGYMIASRVSATAVDVYGDASSEMAADTVAVSANQSFTLPEDFGAPRLDPIYGEDLSVKYMARRPAQTAERLHAWTLSRNKPMVFGVRVQANSSASLSTRYEIVTETDPDTAYTLAYAYRKNVDKMSAATDYPANGPEQDKALEAMAIAEALRKTNPADAETDRWEATAARLLENAISADVEKRPRNLGQMSDGPQLPTGWWKPVDTVTYE